MNLLLDLFLTLAKVGMFTFGGGYAMISIIEDTCVEKKKWITHEEMMDITVIAESTPGPIAINAATYVGYKQAGIPGSVVATVGIVLPSFVIIYLISSVLDDFLEIAWIANAFRVSAQTTQGPSPSGAYWQSTAAAPFSSAWAMYL